MSRRPITASLHAAAPLFAVAAHAAPPVTGMLTKSGYAVIAIANGNGKAGVARRSGRRFTVRSPAPTMMLQLVSPRGSHAGTIVVGRKGSRAVVGVRAGARLGTVRVLPGYGKPSKPLAPRFVDASRTARATAVGVPIGPASFGLTKAKSSKELSREAQAAPAPGPAGGATGPDTASAGGDPDQDGVPNAVGIDANGNGVIDANDPNAPRAAAFQTFTTLFVDVLGTVNADAEPGSTARIDSLMVSTKELVFLGVPSGATLDCNGLTWCSPGGTGRIQPARPP
ncbi:MAG: hypothetical protein FJW92_00080 [Actinobacteria bacterium]|nr:hypothetical protein [Actinomycetota bacterium]